MNAIRSEEKKIGCGTCGEPEEARATSLSDFVFSLSKEQLQDSWSSPDSLLEFGEEMQQECVFPTVSTAIFLKAQQQAGLAIANAMKIAMSFLRNTLGMIRDSSGYSKHFLPSAKITVRPLWEMRLCFPKMIK